MPIFMNLLGDKLQRLGCTVRHANAIVDFLIVSTTVEAAERTTTVVIGDDTDLLVLQICHILHV